MFFVKEKKLPVKLKKHHDKAFKNVSVMKDKPFMLHLANMFDNRNFIFSDFYYFTIVS